MQTYRNIDVHNAVVTMQALGSDCADETPSKLPASSTSNTARKININRGTETVATLYCCDAYAIRPTLGFMDCDVMDPPYLLRTSGGGRYRKARQSMDEIADTGIDKGFDLSIINPLMSGAVICFCHNDQLPPLLHQVDGQFDRFALLDWTKATPQPVANKHYRPDREFYIHAWNKGYHPQGELADKARSITAAPDRSLKKRFGHPTIKPPAVMDKIMRNIAGATVCDSFMGTGSTGVAAVQSGKRFFGIENNPIWFEAAVTRITEAVEEMARNQEISQCPHTTHPNQERETCVMPH